MTRFVLVASAVLFTQNSTAAVEGLKKLNCTASNGVQIQSLEIKGESLQVETAWGLMTRRFDASLTALGYGVETGILLKPEGGGTEYGIELSLNPESKTVQRKTGSLYMRLGQVKQWVAHVNCKVQLSHSTETETEIQR